MRTVQGRPPIVTAARGRDDYRNGHRRRGFRQLASSALNRAVPFANSAAAFLGINYLFLEQAIMPAYNAMNNSDSSDLEKMVGKMALAAAMPVAGYVSYQVSKFTGQNRLITRAANRLADVTVSALYAPYRIYKALKHEEPPALGKGRRKVLKFGVIAGAAALAAMYIPGLGITGSRSIEPKAGEGGEQGVQVLATGQQTQQPSVQGAQYRIQIRPDERNFLERVLMVEVLDYDPSYPKNDYLTAISSVINVAHNRVKSNWFPGQDDFVKVLTAPNQFSAVGEASNWGLYFNPNGNFNVSQMDDKDLDTYMIIKGWQWLPEQQRQERLSIVRKKFQFIREAVDTYMSGAVRNPIRAALIPGLRLSDEEVENIVYYKQNEGAEGVIWDGKYWPDPPSPPLYTTFNVGADSKTLPLRGRHSYFMMLPGNRIIDRETFLNEHS